MPDILQTALCIKESSVIVSQESANRLEVSGDTTSIYISEESAVIVSQETTSNLEIIVPQINLVTLAEQGPVGVKGDRGVIGPEGPSGSLDPVINFSWGDATPALLKIVPAGSRMLMSRLYLDVPFNGFGATLSLGTLANPSLLWGWPTMDPTVVATYEVKPNLVFGVDTSIFLFVSPGQGGSQGSGSAMLQYQ